MLRIGLAYSLKPEGDQGADDGPDDRFEEFDRPETIDGLAEAIRTDGHDVMRLGDGREFVAKMLADPPDFVFNIAEGQGSRRDREARVPAVCEMLGVPYSGSDPLTLATSLDKGVARILVAERGVTVPEGAVVGLNHGFEDGEDVMEIFHRLRERGRLPVIVKPTYEGSSKGIRDGGVFESGGPFQAAVGSILFNYQQPVLIEEFIAGDELTVGIIGNEDDADVVGIMRVVPRADDPLFVYSLEVKRDWANRVTYEAPAVLPAMQEVRLRLDALRAYRALGCRDLARIDFRLKDGVPYFIEANPLPGLSPGTSDLVILAEGYGISHGDLVRRILRTALARVGLGDRGSTSA